MDSCSCFFKRLLCNMYCFSLYSTLIRMHESSYWGALLTILMSILHQWMYGSLRYVILIPRVEPRPEGCLRAEHYRMSYQGSQCFPIASLNLIILLSRLSCFHYIFLDVLIGHLVFFVWYFLWFPLHGIKTAVTSLLCVIDDVWLQFRYKCWRFSTGSNIPRDLFTQVPKLGRQTIILKRELNATFSIVSEDFIRFLNKL